jgi:hypothetical protein
MINKIGYLFPIKPFLEIAGFTFNQELFEWSLGDFKIIMETCDDFIVNNKTIKYVHELESEYLAATGKELDWK